MNYSTIYTYVDDFKPVGFADILIVEVKLVDFAGYLVLLRAGARLAEQQTNRN